MLRWRRKMVKAATGMPTPETDGYRWAARSEVAGLCWPRMGAVLLSLSW